MGLSRSNRRRAECLAAFARSLVIFGVAILCAPAASAQTAVTNPPPYLTTNVLNGPVAERLNIVVLGDGYTAAQAALFQSHVNNAVNYMLGIEPYRSYRSYHNVFSITAASRESGADHPSAGTYKDTYFDATYDSNGIPWLLTVRQGARVSLLLSQFCPDYDCVLVIVNDAVYGGSGGVYAVTSIHASAPQVAMHELGHSFGLLTDEYETITPGYVQTEGVNCTAVTNRAKVKWKVWIEPTTPVPTPESATWDAYAGLFEGCMYTNAGWYRPHYNSYMRSNGRPVGQINGDQLIKRFYSHTPDHIEPFRMFTPSSTSLVINGIQTLSFGVEPMVPDFHSLAVAWSLNGTVQAGQTGTNWSIGTSALGRGLHWVACTVSDPTSQVRIHTNASFPTDPMIKTVEWRLDVQSVDRPTVTITNPVNGSVVPLISNITVVAVASASNGIARVEFLADAVKFAEAVSPPYSVLWAPPMAGVHTLVARAIANLGETNTSAPVAVTLFNDPWTLWRYEHFTAEQLALPISSEFGDFEHDGVPNLIEYAFGLEPKVGDAGRLPKAVVLDNRLTLTYTRSLVTTDITYIVDVADSPAGPWNSGPSFVSEQTLYEGGSTRTIRATDLSTDARARFMRLRISRP